MPKGRKNGCPVNVRDWLIYIQDKAQVSETWVRIYGLDSIKRDTGSSTEDGSAETDLWEEPYITKRNCKLTISGKPIVDMGTGTPDAGQEMLDSYAENGNCDGEATLKIVDPYGHTIVADYIVTDTSTDTDSSDNTISWDLQQVGEPEVLPYYQMSSITLKKAGDGGTLVDAGTTLTLDVGDAPVVLTIDFNPSNASNKRFRVNVSGRKFVRITNITETTFTIVPIAVGSATVTITTMNGNKTDSIAVTVGSGS